MNSGDSCGDVSQNERRRRLPSLSISASMSSSISTVSTGASPTASTVVMRAMRAPLLSDLLRAVDRLPVKEDCGLVPFASSSPLDCEGRCARGRCIGGEPSRRSIETPSSKLWGAEHAPRAAPS